MEKERLPVHEWMAICVVILFFLGLSFFSLASQKISFPETSSVHSLTKNQVEVIIEGCVECPQSYTVEKGTTIREAIALARLSPDADLSGLKLGKRVSDGMVITVPKAPTITIYIEGAVENTGALTVKKGTLLRDLIPLMTFLPHANTKTLMKKRKLKDGETITIPNLN